MSKAAKRFEAGKRYERRKPFAVVVGWPVADALSKAATSRSMTTTALAVKLLNAAVRDNLIDAILDDRSPEAAE